MSHKALDIDPQNKTSYTAQQQEAFLQYVKNEYCAKHRQVSVIKPKHVLGSNVFPSAKAYGFGLSS